MESHEVLRETLKAASAKQVAADMNLSLSLVYKWAEQPTADSPASNPLDRIDQLLRCTRDVRILQWLCERSGGFFIRNPEACHPHPSHLIPATNQVVQEFADLLAVIAAASSDNAITQAEAQVQIARGQYAELASHPTAAEITAADARVAVAQTAVEHAQAAYNLVRGDPQIASRPESLALYQATAAHAAALAEAALIKAGPTPEQLAVVNDQILAAEAAREMTRARAPGSEAATQAALADLARAQAALDGLVAGATTEEIAMAEARAQQARAAQRMAEAQLAQAQVRAPFAGQIGSISTRVGELATPGTSLLLLGDPTVLFVETTDLRETDVVRLRLGMAVEVSFDALPDRLFQGTISEIAPVSNTDRGSTNYTVRIDVTDLDPALRWGMTAFVNILAPR